MKSIRSPWIAAASLLMVALRAPAEDPCKSCKATLQVPCFACAGKQSVEVPCVVCDAKGSCACPFCKAKGTVECGICEGLGRPKQGNRRCLTCDGRRVVDCRVCEGGKATCQACDGKGKRSRPCALCLGPGKLPCSECGLASERGTCRRCDGTTRESCPACRASKGTPARCEDCGGMGSVPCSRCMGSLSFQCGGCWGGGNSEEDRGTAPQNKEGKFCKHCGDRWYMCQGCMQKGTQSCKGCARRGFVEKDCLSCGGKRDIACRWCATGRTWVGIEPGSGATVRIILLDGFEPHIASALPALLPESSAWACRIVVDAREASSASSISDSDGWTVFGQNRTGSPIPLGSLSSRVATQIQDPLKRHLPSWGVSPDLLAFPFLTARGRVGTRLLWSMTPPDLERGFVLRRKGAEEARMTEESMKGDVWMRLLAAANKK